MAKSDKRKTKRALLKSHPEAVLFAEVEELNDKLSEVKDIVNDIDFSGIEVLQSAKVLTKENKQQIVAATIKLIDTKKIAKSVLDSIDTKKITDDAIAEVKPTVPTLKQLEELVDPIIKNQIKDENISDVITETVAETVLKEIDAGFNRLVDENPKPIRDALEKLEGQERLRLEAIRGTEKIIEDIDKLKKRPVGKGGAMGGPVGINRIAEDGAIRHTGTGILNFTNNLDVTVSGNVTSVSATGGASQLSDLSDVNTSTPTNRNVLVADGVDWESRALVEADISDLGSYITASSTDTLTNKTFDANGTGNSLSNVDVADLANGTDGELITWDAAGAPATVATGSSGEVLTSNGAGAAPTFQAAAGGAPGGADGDLQINNSGAFGTLDGLNLENVGTRNARGTGALDIQSVRSADTQVASGNCSTTIGQHNTASGYCSSAIGNGNSVSVAGNFSNVIGYSNASTSLRNTAMGYDNSAAAACSAALGVSNSTVAGDTFASAIGTRNTASNLCASAIGHCTLASGCKSTAVGMFNCATGNCSTALGNNTDATSNFALGVGYLNRATAGQATAVGYNNCASTNGTSVGYSNCTVGVAGTGVGFDNTAAGCCSTAVGHLNIVCSLACGGSAFGRGNTSSGYFAFTAGTNNTASASRSYAIGAGITNATADNLDVGITDTAKLSLACTGVSTASYTFANLGTGNVTASSGAISTSATVATASTSQTLGVAATAIAASSNVMTITGDGGGNTIATITGGVDGQLLTLIFVDALVTITDDNTHGADSVDLSAAFTSADDTTLQLVYDGTSWYEVSRSVN